MPSHVPSVFMGLHYFIGRDPKPRVVEAHLALIKPTSAGVHTVGGHAAYKYDRADPDSWVLSTFAVARGRCQQHGLYSGVTMLAEEKLAVRH